jgi:hypothetical protein
MTMYFENGHAFPILWGFYAHIIKCDLAAFVQVKLHNRDEFTITDGWLAFTPFVFLNAKTQNIVSTPIME